MSTYGSSTYGAVGGTYAALGTESSMPTVVAQAIVRGGVTPVFVAATADGDRVRPSHTMFLRVRNAGGAPVTVSPAPTFINQVGNPSLPTAVAVPAGQERWLGPFPPDFYRASDGLMDVEYSDATDVAICVLDLPAG